MRLKGWYQRGRALATPWRGHSSLDCCADSNVVCCPRIKYISAPRITPVPTSDEILSPLTRSLEEMHRLDSTHGVSVGDYAVAHAFLGALGLRVLYECLQNTGVQNQPICTYLRPFVRVLTRGGRRRGPERLEATTIRSTTRTPSAPSSTLTGAAARES